MRVCAPATRRPRTTVPPAARPGAHPLEALSRAAGNQAVVAMLARQPVATEQKPLLGAQGQA